MEATDNYRRIRIAFYVALTEKACKRVDLLRSMKKLLPDVGIIRVKPDGHCRHYLWIGKDKVVKLSQPRPAVSLLDASGQRSFQLREKNSRCGWPLALIQREASIKELLPPFGRFGQMLINWDKAPT